MLYITLKRGEHIIIEDVVKVYNNENRQIDLKIDAPREISVKRIPLDPEVSRKIHGT